MQWWRKTFEIGEANNSCACVSTHMVGGSGGMLLQENLCKSELILLAQSSTTVIIVICTSCMYDCNLYRCPHPMQWRRPLMKSPNF